MTTSTGNEAPVRGFRRVFGDRDASLASRRSRPLRQRVRLPLMLAGPILVLIAGGWWYLTSGRYVSTDDAYIQAARTMVSADISGRVVAIAVKDNERVTKGQLLFQLDDRPYRIAVEEATAMLASARLQVEAMKATYGQKVADAKAAEDTLAYQQREFDRQRQLAASGTASRQVYDQSQNALQTAQQKVISTQSDIANILAQLGGNPDIPVADHPLVQRAQAALDKATLDLSYTTVRAHENGIVTKVEQLQVGSYVTASTPVFSMMSDRIWVEANFKETELTYMRPGQKATVEVDTYPGVVFDAKVVSLSPGTGLSFSLLPPENATGNWVKVVQRLPVRLALESPDPDHLLHAGLSATVDVDTQYRRPWLAWLDRVTGHLFGAAEAGEKQR
ncbi:MAG TPA: HlyD family secretion protein [Stellaceae bacterium]|nr:HlyD family secretion protein [Stellaceae bacterium]